VTRTLAFAQFSFQEPPPLPEMPDFITHHIDPFTGDDDTADIDAAPATSSRACRRSRCRSPMIPEAGSMADSRWTLPVSRNAPCPCGSGEVQALPRAARLAQDSSLEKGSQRRRTSPGWAGSPSCARNDGG
jgi:hypothetical protein